MNTLEELLDKVYELEGLVQLAISRSGDAPERICELIRAKGEAVATAIASAFPADSRVGEESVPQSDGITPEPDGLASYSLEEDDESEETPEIREAESAEEDQLSLAAETEEEEAAEADVTTESVEASETVDYQASPTDPAKAVSESSRGKHLRQLFSINDRFRFARELFGGSTRTFDDTLAFLDSALDYNEVEDYFIVEQDWDSDNASVKEFLEILERGFAR